MSGENDSREWIARHTSENLISDNLVVMTPPLCLICNEETGSSIAVFARNLFVGKMDGPQGFLDMAVKKIIPRPPTGNWPTQHNIILSMDSNLLYWNYAELGKFNFRLN